MENIEYEYSFKAKSITPYIDYCKKNGYTKISITSQNRIVYENKHIKGIIARITTDIKDGIENTVFDCKNVNNKNENLKISTESMPLVITEENKDIILSILNTLDFFEAANNLRTRYVYEKNNVIFEIDDYTRPEMKVIAIEGKKEEVDKVCEEIKIILNEEKQKAH